MGKFNISEDPKDRDTITIRPIMVDTPLKIVFSPNAIFSGKKVSVVRNATKSVEQEYEISSKTSSIELIPQGKASYLMKVANDGGVSAKHVQSMPQQNPKTSSKSGPVPKPERKAPSEPARFFECVTIPQISSEPISDLTSMFDRHKRKVCANCKETYIEGDKYCRYCGAPMGKAAYIEEIFADIYGPPPVKRVHSCKKCGYCWETGYMIDDERYCPKCGGSAPVTSAEEWM